MQDEHLKRGNSSKGSKDANLSGMFRCAISCYIVCLAVIVYMLYVVVLFVGECCMLSCTSIC